MEKIARLIQALPFLLLVGLVSEGFLPRCSRAQPAESFETFFADDSVFSLSCRDASLRDVLGHLAAQKGFNLAGLDVIPPGVTLSTHLETRCRLKTGLLALLAPQGFTLDKARRNLLCRTKTHLKTGGYRSTSPMGSSPLMLNLIDVNQVIRALAGAGISVTSASDLTGRVTAHLRDQPLEAKRCLPYSPTSPCTFPTTSTGLSLERGCSERG